MISLPLSPSPFNWAYLVLMFLFFFISILYRGVRRDPGVVRSSSLELLLFIAVNLSFIGMPLMYAVTSWFDGLNYTLPTFLSYIGLGGLIVAFLIRAKAHADLGKSFTIAAGTTRRRDMVTGGIYSHVRHPMYLSMLLWGIFTPLVLQNYLVGFLPLLSIAIFLMVRLPVEEEFLLNEFGDWHSEYRSRTGGLWPRLKG